MPRKNLDDWVWQLDPNLRQLIGSVRSQTPLVAKDNAWEPRVDLIETEGYLVLKAELAGVDLKKVVITYDPEHSVLSLSGSRGAGDLPEPVAGGVHQLEIQYGEFKRQVRLPEIPLLAEQIRADYRGGFLYVVLPKVTEQNYLVVRKTIRIRKT